ncbi:RNA polymerase sigma factor [Parabacteroides sp. FAFU027]|uniref:RNA polymerase sigma factor n=1 Tax=Parabacteroides sp. FAFU027 TaxID=2922715 RepID=UPI001FAED639|nr:sigma-70 family RNA polymerase sigma factor [Parabacteroides sp. FAFU027]
MKIRHTYSDLSDEDLVIHYRNSSEQVMLGQLYSRYIPLVYGLCLKYLQHQEDAEDAVMQIYEELSVKVCNYDIANFKTWLYSVAKNHCLQILRKHQPFTFEEISEKVVETDHFEHLLDINENIEKETALNYCLKTLPEEQKRCIVHFFFEECSYADVVELTGFALNKVKSYIQNGKRNLKICMVKVLNH